MDFSRAVYREDDSIPVGQLPFSSHTEEVSAPRPMAGAHIHNKIELLYCLSGQLNVRVNSECFRFVPGDLILINSNAIHSTESLGEGKNAYFVFQFHPECLYSAMPTTTELKYLLPFTLQNASTQKFFSAAELRGTVVPHIMQALQTEYVQRQFGFELALRLEVQRLFLWMLRKWNAQGVQFLLDCGGNAQKMSDAFSYIWQNYAQNVTAAQMAGLCKMSYSYFSRFFCRITGQSFVRYLNSVRILHAKTLLSTTKLSVTEIAFQVGFSSSSYFVSQFRRAEGLPPYRYRQLISKET